MQDQIQDELPIRNFADLGLNWLLDYPPNLRSLLRLAAGDMADNFDFDRATRVNRTLVSEKFRKKEADLIYKVPFKSHEGEALVYLLLENQTRPDPTMTFRLLSSMVELWRIQMQFFEDNKIPDSKRRLDPILPMVFYTGKRKWKPQISLISMMNQPPSLNIFTPKWDVLFLSLGGLTAAQFSGSALGSALRVMRAADDSLDILSEEFRAATAVLEALPPEFHAEWRRAYHFLIMLIRHKRSKEEQPMLYNMIDDAVNQTHLNEVKEIGMTITEADVARGKLEGKAEGKIEGKKSGKLELIIELLTSKFGTIAERTKLSLDGKTEADLAKIGRQLLSAQSIQDLGL